MKEETKNTKNSWEYALSKNASVRKTNKIG